MVKNPRQLLRFEIPVQQGERLLQRTHPFVETLANHVLETALDPLSSDAQRYTAARRCGAISSSGVSIRTTLLILRFRYHIIKIQGNSEKPLLAEDCRLLAFTGSPENAEWLDETGAEYLLALQPDGNILPQIASQRIQQVIDGFGSLRKHVDEAAIERGKELLDAHQRVRNPSKLKNLRFRIEPQLPPDVLGIYIYLPKVG